MHFGVSGEAFFIFGARRGFQRSLQSPALNVSVHSSRRDQGDYLAGRAESARTLVSRESRQVETHSVVLACLSEE